MAMSEAGILRMWSRFLKQCAIVICAEILCAVLFFSLSTPAQAPSTQDIVVQVTGPAEGAAPANGTGFINGWAASVEGQTILYHSAVPGTTNALIVRAQRIAHSITWKTDPLSSSGPGDSYHLLWLAGLDFSGWSEDKVEHTFDFFINRKHWFTFKNLKGATARKWAIPGDDGAELSFNATTADKFGDLFGYMHLDLPKKDFPAGAPLTLSVVGHDDDSADWYMTFEYAFQFTPRARVDPAEMRDGSVSAQVLRLSLDNLTENRSVLIRMGDRELVRGPLNVGGNIFRIPIPAVKTTQKMKMLFSLNGAAPGSFTFDVAPVTPRTIYLVPYSHNDIGYTDYQPNVERKQWSNLEQGLRLASETRAYPAEDRFKWNLETVWALESYLRQASEAQRKAVFDAIENGELGVSALYANMLTGLANATEMSHFLDYSRTLKTKYNITVHTAVTSDVPGFTWGIVPTLAQSGVKYFAVGPNTGDRIGYTLETWGDKPFYWASQSGEEKILIWIAGAGYSSFHEGSLSNLGDEKIMALARQLQKKNYPYEMVYLPYTTGDNGPPDPKLAATVKDWNERYVTPRLVIATHDQMFQEFEKRYGASLPVLRGDFTPYWEDGAASTAAELALARRAVDRLTQGEALWSLLAPRNFPRNDYESAWRDISFWDEHTWGADKSVSDPDLPIVKQEWEFKRKFAVDAAQSAEDLLARAAKPAAGTAAERIAFDIYNLSSWPRTDIILLPAAQTVLGDRVTDGQGRPVPSQRLTTGELAAFVGPVPPLSAKRLFVGKGTAFQQGGTTATANGLENGDIDLEVSPQSGAINSLRLKNKNISLVDDHAAAGWGEYIYVPGTDPAKAQRLSHVRVRVKENGPLVVSLLIEGDAPGAKSYSSEIRLVAGLDRVDMVTKFDKLQVREKESVHIAFPFRVPGGRMRYDVADAIVRPPEDQLAGACKNFFSVDSWADVSNTDYGVTLAVPDAPLIEMGAITAEQPWMKTIEPSPLLYSYALNNYWHTNYKADQEGPIELKYSIEPHGAFAPAAAARFGRERREPLVIVPAETSRTPVRSIFQISPAEIMVSSIRPIADGNAWLIYLYNPTDVPRPIVIQFDPGMKIVMRKSDAFGQASGASPTPITIPAYGSMYVRAQRSAPH
ncbi:MAG TPA: glycoside hydrolase family 38 C-terminal domain-containing protein [Candidatus Limnocylindrales bacterium]|nr:glycoside hydrolase family 38 C-terminal domain-containing protein [Candidatus Limnocylindrales bacterium]